eukprot:1179223-Amphidinium_carterae.1
MTFDPTLWHGTDLVTKGIRFSCSFFTAAGLSRVPSHTWALLQQLQFNIKEAVVESKEVCSLAAW